MGILKMLFSNKVTNTILNKITSKGFSSTSILILIIGTYMGFNPDLLQQIAFSVGSMNKIQQKEFLDLVISVGKNILWLWIIILLIKNLFVISINEETVFINIIRKILRLNH